MSLQDTRYAPREKLQSRGPQNLKDCELLAILLRTGCEDRNVLQVARGILEKYPPEKFADLDARALQSIHGIGPAKACTVVAAIEFSRRVLSKGLGSHQTVREPRDVLGLVANIRASRKEHFVGIYLNSRHQVIRHETISVGSLDASLVHPREVFQPAIESSAAAAIFVHNHPSGDVTPSREDLLVTKRLCEAGRILGIDVLDHIIVSSEGLLSMKAQDCAKTIGFTSDG